MEAAVFLRCTVCQIPLGALLDQSQELDFIIWKVRPQFRSLTSSVAGPSWKVGLYVLL